MKKRTVFRQTFLTFLIAIGLESPLPALDPSAAMTDYLRQSWKSEDGLPQNTISTILQTADGFIWVGTPSGLVRFDGFKFKIYTTANIPALKNDRITTLHEDIFGRLWIGSDGGGVCCLQDGKWQYFTTRDGLSNDHIRSITSDWQGTLWIGTDYGLNHYDQEGFRQYTPRDGLYDHIVTALAMDSRGFLWIGTLRGGLMQFQSGVIHGYGYREGLQDEAVLSLLADRMNNIWIGTLHGLYLINGGDGRVQFIWGSTYTPVTALLEDPQGTVWVGTMADGLKRMKGNRFSGVPGSNGFPTDNIRTLFCDRDENLWIGSDADGLFCLKNRRVHNIGSREGLPEGAASAVLQDMQGDLWIGMSNGGICRLRKGKIINTWNTSGGLSSNQVTALCEDPGGTIWIGTHDQGLNAFQSGSIKHLGREQGLTSLMISSLLQDKNGTLWIGTDRGLNRMAAGKSMEINPAGPVSHHINVLLMGRQGELYAGSREGLFIYRDNSFTTAIPDTGFIAPDVLSLFEDRQEILWIGTNGRGLMRLKGDSIRTWTTADGLPDNHIFSICEDDSGSLWLSSYNGVFRIKRGELESPDPGTGRFIVPAWFDENDGMASSRCSANGQPAVWKGEDGRLYYPTAKGITIFRPAVPSWAQTAARAVIESIRAEGRPVPSDQPLTFTYPLKHLSIQFTAADFASPRKLNFFYRLEDAGPGWTRPTSTELRQADFYDLKPGNYRFMLKAVPNGASRQQAETVLAFSINLPFYRHPFFMGSLLLLISVAVITTFYLRQQKKKRKKQEKYKTSALDPRKAAETVPQLLILMERDKIFLQPNLNLKSLAKALRIHPNHLSRIINEHFALSFNDYINQWRIEEAKKLLLKDGERKNILEILYECGFYSKSVFNTAFRKFTGMTPSQYRHLNSGARND